MYFTRKTLSTYRLIALPTTSWLLAIMLIVFMGFIYWLLSSGATLSCQRSSNGQGECVMDSGDHQKTFPANDLVGATVYGSTMFSTFILTKTETITFGNMSTSDYSGVAKVVDKVNEFVKNRDLQSLHVDNSDFSFVWLLCMGIFTVIALGLLLFSRIIILELDKTRDSLIMRWVGLVPRQPLNCKLSSVQQVKYLPAGSSSSSGYIVMLITKEGEMPLTGITSGWIRARSVANSMNDFLGVK